MNIFVLMRNLATGGWETLRGNGSGRALVNVDGEVLNNPEASFDGGVFSTASTVNGTFQWDITTVPANRRWRVVALNMWRQLNAGEVIVAFRNALLTWIVVVPHRVLAALTWVEVTQKTYLIPEDRIVHADVFNCTIGENLSASLNYSEEVET